MGNALVNDGLTLVNSLLVTDGCVSGESWLPQPCLRAAPSVSRWSCFFFSGWLVEHRQAATYSKGFIDRIPTTNHTKRRTCSMGDHHFSIKTHILKTHPYTIEAICKCLKVSWIERWKDRWWIYNIYIYIHIRYIHAIFFDMAGHNIGSILLTREGLATLSQGGLLVPNIWSAWLFESGCCLTDAIDGVCAYR